MIRWKYIATQLAQKFSQLPFGGRYTDEHLARSWASLFDIPVGMYYDERMMSGNLAVMYNFFMTIAELQGIADGEKVKKILHLLRLITGGYDATYVDRTLKDAGFIEKVEFEDEGKELGHILKFHPEILKHCADLYKRGHYLNCVHEVCKAYNKAVQAKSKSDRDGKALMLWALGEKGNIRINSYKTQSERDEQDGIMFLSAGLMAGFRNPTSHETANTWDIPKERCLEILALVSLLFRVLEESTVVPLVV